MATDDDVLVGQLVAARSATLTRDELAELLMLAAEGVQQAVQFPAISGRLWDALALADPAYTLALGQECFDRVPAARLALITFGLHHELEIGK